MENGILVKDNLVNLIAKIGEKITIRRASFFDSSNGVNFSYVHSSIEKGIGKIISIEKLNEIENNDIGTKIAMHIAAFNPVAVNDEDVSADVLAREKDIIEAKAKESGKPDNIVEKMIEGGLRKYLDEVTLLRQPYVMDNDKKVGDVLKAEGVKVLGFKRLEVGEGIEKKQEDFAAEVAAAQAASK